MGKRFSKRRWRRPERMLLDADADVVRRKDLGSSEPIAVETELGRKTSRRAIEVVLVSFIVLGAVEGAIVGLVAHALLYVFPAFVLYAFGYFVLAREFGDGWIVKALRAKPAESPRLERLISSEARTAGVAAPRLLISAASAPNAFSFALRRRWVVVTSPSVDEDELALEAMFAHEIIHLRDGDASVAALFIVLAASPELVLRRAGPLTLLSIPLWPAALALRFVRSFAFDAGREHRADVAAAMMTRYPPGMATALTVAGGGSSGLRSADPFWFVPRGSDRVQADRRAALIAEM
jgi:Zn-dependent protease with chaperone function